MGIITWLTERLKDGTAREMRIEEKEFFGIATQFYVRNLAFQTGVNLIANAVSKCEFKTYVGGKENRGREYYLFNVEPNKNQNSSEFIHKLISKLYEKNECLVIETTDHQLLVADSYMKKEYAVYENTFSQVTVGDMTFKRIFRMSEVLYFKLNNRDIRNLLNGLYENYGHMIEYAQKNYKKLKGRKGILKVEAIAEGKENFEEVFEDIMNQYFKTFFDADNAVLPLFEGYNYDELDNFSGENTRDIRSMIDDIYDFTARALRIPPTVLRGDVADVSKAVDNLLTFCIDPLTDLIQEEITRKRCGLDGFLKGIYLEVDTKTIKHIDLLSVATAIDKLIASGAFCINDIRKAVGEAPINEEWANQHFITKNYEAINDALKALEGG